MNRKANRVLSFILLFILLFSSLVSANSHIERQDKENYVNADMEWENPENYNGIEWKNEEYKQKLNDEVRKKHNAWGYKAPTIRFKVIAKYPGGGSDEFLITEEGITKNGERIRMYYNNPYKTFRQTFDKLNKTGAHKDAVVEAINKTAQDRRLWKQQADSNDDRVIPVGTKLYITDMTIPGTDLQGNYFDSNGNYNQEIIKYDMQVVDYGEEYAVNQEGRHKVHTTESLQTGKGEFFYEAKESGYAALSLNASDDLPVYYTENGQQKKFSTMAEDGNWRNYGGNPLSVAEGKVDKYDPWTIDWYFRQIVFKVVDDLDTNINVAHKPNNSDVKMNNNDFTRMEVRMYDNNKLDSKVLNTQDCGDGNKVCGTVTDGEKYNVRLYLQRDRNNSYPKDHAVIIGDLQMDLKAKLGSSFGDVKVVENDLNSFKSNEKMKTDEISFMYSENGENKNRPFTDITGDIFGNRRISQGDIVAYEFDMTIPELKDLNNNQGIFNTSGKIKYGDYLTLQSELDILTTKKNDEGKPYKEILNNDLTDDFTKAVLQIHRDIDTPFTPDGKDPEDPDNEITIVEIVPEDPKDPGDPDKFEPSDDRDKCVNITLADNYTLYIDVNRVKGDGDKIVKPEIESSYLFYYSILHLSHCYN